jgi:hypothetical protein
VQGSLTCRKIVQHGADGFPSSLKEGMLWIFIALKIHYLWPCLNLQTLVSNDKHANYYTTKDDIL